MVRVAVAIKVAPGTLQEQKMLSVTMVEPVQTLPPMTQMTRMTANP